MSTESIEQLIESEVQRRLEQLIESEVQKRLAQQLVTPEEGESIYQVGAPLLIRTVTHYTVGRVCFVSDREIGMVDASWVASTGRFHECLTTGTLSESEPWPGRMSVNPGAIVDSGIWCHDLPSEVIE